ncbi:MAG: recombinase family protein [Oscillospiraceae bacterium]
MPLLLKTALIFLLVSLTIHSLKRFFSGVSFSLERQAEELRRYAEQAGYTIVGVAAEHGSGLTLDRPALQELTEAVLAGKVDAVLVNSLDRLGRDWGMTKQYIDLLTEHKVKLLCVRERVMIDSSSFSPFFT